MFSEKRSLNLRVWHWLSAIAVFGLMLTYILRKTALNYKTNAQILQVKLSEIGVALADDKAKEIAKIFRDNMWQAHYCLGFAFIALLLFRLYAFVSKQDKFPLCKIKEAKDSVLNEKSEYIKAKYAHVVFYAAAIYMSISGLVMYFREALGIDKGSLGLVKELHEWAFWFFALFIIAHIAGVIKAELTNDKGIVSSMFNGKE
ncbi:MAG TPA: cytochrome b/b6 domain-containing protein [Campylobacterales bacterium]|nr:cytochrome b/b6 domain-containing protein [Campylobacterales bacterium]